MAQQLFALDAKQPAPVKMALGVVNASIVMKPKHRIML